MTIIEILTEPLKNFSLDQKAFLESIGFNPTISNPNVHQRLVKRYTVTTPDDFKDTTQAILDIFNQVYGNTDIIVRVIS